MRCWPLPRPLLILPLLCACAHGGALNQAQLAQRCPALPARAVAEGGNFQRAFLEFASVKKGELPDPLAELSQEPVPAYAVGGALAEHETPLTLDWDRCLDARCELKLRRTLMIAADLPRSAADPIGISVHIREHNGDEVSVYAEHGETRNQRPLALDEHGERTMLVVTPYLISNDADLKTLLACKQANRSAARQGNK